MTCCTQHNEVILRLNSELQKGLLIWGSPPLAISILCGVGEIPALVSALNSFLGAGVALRTILIARSDVRFALLPSTHSSEKICVLVRGGLHQAPLPVELRGTFTSHTLMLGETTFQITAKLDGFRQSPPSVIQHGDVLLLEHETVRAGGHHSNATVSLPAGSTFESRCEFATNAHGWLASDEMTLFIRQIQYGHPTFAHFTPILTWDLDETDVEQTFDDLTILNNQFTIVPILAGSHWAAFEIDRQAKPLSKRCMPYSKSF